MTLLQTLRPAARDLDQSDIVAVINGARNKPGIVPLWVGEGDLPTPDFITSSAKAAMDAGETFYTWQRGIPELRQALADYHTRHYRIENDPQRFFVTGSGMQAIQLSLQALAGAGDEVVMTTPCWPNIHSATQVAGGKPVHVELDFSQNGWSLDTEKLFAAVTDRTRALFINTPANPTGWVAPLDTLREILDFARERGIWIIADEVYHRFVYDRDLAPSFYELIEPDDRVIFVNTFSKNWAMTGWRAGWISAPPEMGQVLENLIQYSTSGVAPFTQRAAATGLNDGEDFIAMQKARAHRNRDVICDALNGTGRVELAKPAGAFYLFFKVPGYPDSKKLALRLIEEANVGLAPGSGFYSGGGEFLRMCFLRDPAQIDEGAERLVEFLNGL
ncbi:MAG: pyridoxal phosphate-dependent aminotransferase [Pseudomonadota bacterium]